MKSITLELSSELEAKLLSLISRHDKDSIRQLLAEAFTPTVEALLQEAFEPLNNNDFEAQADQLAAELAEYTGFNSPILSDYAVSREGIYGEHS